MSSICQFCKMLRAESIVLFLVVSFALSISALEIGLSQNRNGTSPAAARNSSNLNVMEKCNRTFQISAEFLQELNDTGSFPDEGEKTPMCYVKCTLETQGALKSDGNFDVEAIKTMFDMDSDETVFECLNETNRTALTHECEKAYFLVRCIMTRHIVDNMEAQDE